MEAARLRGLKLLTIRSRGRSELIRSLEEKGFTAAAAREAARKLEKEGWLDDAAAARAFVRSRSRRYGRVRIEREMSARGFSREAVAAALLEIDEGAEERALSRLFARARKAAAGVDSEARRRRIWNSLARRGFGAAAISAKMKGRFGGDQDRDDIG